MAGWNFVVTGGGTGGHIYPALAIARGLKRRLPQAQVFYLGTAEGLEARLVPEEGLPFYAIKGAGLKRRLTLGNMRALLRAFQGLLAAYRLLGQLSPRVVVGTGGYVAGPVVLAAWLRRLPVLIHEQNAFPGLTNRWLARLAQVTALTFPEAARFLHSRGEVVVTGLPVREEILQVSREEARVHLGLGSEDRLLVSFGGSRGASSLNRAVKELVRHYSGRQGVYLCHATGEAHYASWIRELEAEGVRLAANIRIYPYFRRIADFLGAADLAICRAGAATLAELTCLGCPSILVPYPYATGRHQEYNARALAEQGAAVVIADSELTGARLLSEVERLLTVPEELLRMAQAAKAMGKPEALDLLVDLVIRLAGS
ncbi:undecaprenyldiphospho-muramoylpentapeptide beta-N-acetylglucosaminyltransferase [Desulfothermobacter acidiphilus]|uniref:undecaprenyldiphospho-muramoylpentapeptide beta-N-acetylglucosaminyltransferase n=1 Tax=Desulfothermobacter acidiphilus TaxID=1938353 RepID=UPI003F8C7F9D